MNAKYSITMLALSTLLFNTPAISAENSVIVSIDNSLTESLTHSNIYENPQPTPDISNVKPFAGEIGLIPGSDLDTNDQVGQTRAWGSFGVPFTTSRVQHQNRTKLSSNSPAYLSTTYPYSALGKLTFNAEGQSSQCTASLIRKGVLVTAAHCIQDFGTGNNYFTNFRYTPAAFNSARPFGIWQIELIVLPTSWSDGTDPGESALRANDLALLIVSKDNQNKLVGQHTGNLTYGFNGYSFVKSELTGNLFVSSLTSMDYSGLLDNGKIMQRKDGPTFLANIDGVLQYYQGSDSTGGSSGGPWIANFGFQQPRYSSGAGAGSESSKNVVVGVTSWGTGGNNNSSKNNFGTFFGENSVYPENAYGNYGGGNIGSLMQQICTTQKAGTTKTYQQLGYCNR